MAIIWTRLDGTGQFASSEIRLAAMLCQEEPGPGGGG
jgi:hypothetical protein